MGLFTDFLLFNWANPFHLITWRILDWSFSCQFNSIVMALSHFGQHRPLITCSHFKCFFSLVINLGCLWFCMLILPIHDWTYTQQFWVIQPALVNLLSFYNQNTSTCQIFTAQMQTKINLHLCWFSLAMLLQSEANNQPIERQQPYRSHPHTDANNQ